MQGYVIDATDVKDMKFNSKAEEQYFINSLYDQVTDTEEKIDEEVKDNSSGGLVRAADAPDPLEPRTFYDRVREYNNLYVKLEEYKNLTEMYQKQISDVRDMPKYFESPEALYTYQEIKSKIEGDSNDRLENLKGEVDRHAQRMYQIPAELAQANMPVGVWVNDDVTGKAFLLDKMYDSYKRKELYNLQVEDGEKKRRELNPTKADKAVEKFNKVKGINYTKPLVFREKGEVILLPSIGLWGVYTTVITVLSWIVF